MSHHRRPIGVGQRLCIVDLNHPHRYALRLSSVRKRSQRFHKVGVGNHRVVG